MPPVMLFLHPRNAESTGSKWVTSQRFHKGTFSDQSKINKATDGLRLRRECCHATVDRPDLYNGSGRRPGKSEVFPNVRVLCQAERAFKALDACIDIAEPEVNRPEVCPCRRKVGRQTRRQF